MLRQWEVLSCIEMKSPYPHPCSSSLELLVPLAIGQEKWPESLNPKLHLGLLPLDLKLWNCPGSLSPPGGTGL